MGIQDFFDNVCHCFRNSTSTGDNSDREESLPSASDSELHTAQELKMPPKRASLWQVSLYLTNDTIGAWLTLYGAVILAMYGYITGLLILVLAWPLNVYTAHLLWRCRNVFPGAISIGDLVYYLTRSHAAMYTAFFFVNITILGTLAFQIEAAAANVYWVSISMSLSVRLIFFSFSAPFLSIYRLNFFLLASNRSMCLSFFHFNTFQVLFK